jgi:hypothetical protein
VKRFLCLVIVALVVTGPAAAKEGAQAHLLRPLPTHPAPGGFITVRWTVDVPGPNGARVPFSAIGMFVRLVGRGTSVTAAAMQSAGPPYSARIRVPRGGIRRVRFGLMGTSCRRTTCSPSASFFPLHPTSPSGRRSAVSGVLVGPPVVDETVKPG